ncbi:hypothetical protein GX48_01079 [Paracoccidioides brasiliensis]|nr:hypothetical protein GX48_01079 [Paracoccidioides brasiliensis]
MAAPGGPSSGVNLLVTIKSFISLPKALGRILVVCGLLHEGVSFGFGDTTSTSSGLIRGHKSPSRPDVIEYLGIRYAQSPVGSLRFAKPLAYTSDQFFEALSFDSRDCPQNPSQPVEYPNATNIQKTIIANFAGQTGNEQSEDSTSASKKPVVVWIHGGRFTAGSTNNKFYQGQYIADQEDVVVVSIGYRLDIFGFSGAPWQPQNVGLLDQRMALEWIRDNIAGFGGDPECITIFGQSAGGVAVDYYSYAYTNDPIVSGLISMAGTALSMKPNTMKQSARYWYTAALALGCGGRGDVLDCMRSKSPSEILDTVTKVPPEPSKALAQPVFHPTVDNMIVFSDYEALSAQGKFAKLPMLVGNADYEAGFYRISAFATNLTLTDTQWHLLNLAGFTCAGDRTAGYRASHRVPVWRYRYYGEWPNTIMYPGSGAYHGTDVGQVFETAEDVSGGIRNTESEREVSSYMVHAWAMFARNPQSGLDELGWPKYTAEEQPQKFTALAFKNDPKITILPSGETDAGCAVLGTDTSYAKGAF